MAASGRPAAPAGPFIQVRSLEKWYESRTGRVQAIANMNFSSQRGSITTIVGPSGCGKTTLLRILSGLLPYDRGEVLIGGQPVRGPISNVGLVFQRPALFQWLSVLDNVLAPIRLMGLPRRDYEPKARELLEMAGLAGFENKYPHQLSGGMQQRVSICRALIHDPEVLLMDEPFGALDAMTRERMNLELLRLWAQSPKTIVFITHSIDEAVFLGDQLLVLGSRPSRILEDVPIQLPRPRDLATKMSPEFRRLVFHVNQYFQENGMRPPNVSETPEPAAELRRERPPLTGHA